MSTSQHDSELCFITYFMEVFIFDVHFILGPYPRSIPERVIEHVLKLKLVFGLSILNVKLIEY